jgi:hypothetical protein
MAARASSAYFCEEPFSAVSLTWNHADIRRHFQAMGIDFPLWDVAAANIRQAFHIDTHQTPLLVVLAARHLENIRESRFVPRLFLQDPSEYFATNPASGARLATDFFIDL